MTTGGPGSGNIPLAQHKRSCARLGTATVPAQHDLPKTKKATAPRTEPIAPERNPQNRSPKSVPSQSGRVPGREQRHRLVEQHHSCAHQPAGADSNATAHGCRSRAADDGKHRAGC